MKLLPPAFLVILLLFFSSCTNNSKQTSDYSDAAKVQEMLPEVMALPIVEQLEAAHKVNLFRQKAAISFDIECFFGGRKRLDGTLVTTPGSDGIRIEREDGSVLGYDGEQVWLSPADHDTGGARSAIFTWQYFFMAPFKLSDPGTNWEALEDMTLDGEPHTTAKLTFDTGTGDAPDDWYIAYKDKKTNMLDALAYIVTYRASKAEAEKEPHAITYHNYQDVEGIPIAMEWKFWMWTEEKGIFDQLGEAKISNVKFVDDTEGLFTAPENSQKVSR